jgi:hypothetical protein
MMTITDQLEICFDFFLIMLLKQKKRRKKKKEILFFDYHYYYYFDHLFSSVWLIINRILIKNTKNVNSKIIKIS